MPIESVCGLERVVHFSGMCGYGGSFNFDIAVYNTTATMAYGNFHVTVVI